MTSHSHRQPHFIIGQSLLLGDSAEPCVIHPNKQPQPVAIRDGDAGAF